MNHILRSAQKYVLGLICAAGIAGIFAVPVMAIECIPAGWRVNSISTASNSQLLRGYGRASAVYQKVSSPDKPSAVYITTFSAGSNDYAKTILAKYLADITLSPGVREEILAVNGINYRLLTLDGGTSITGTVLGNNVYIAAGDLNIIKEFALLSPVFNSPVSQPDAAAYPSFLDRFDRYGWGFYGLGGVSNYHDWKKLPGGNPDADPLEDLEFCAKNGFRFELWLDEAKFDNAHAMPYEPEANWMINEAEKRKLPVSARLYGALPNSWEYSDAFEKPAEFLETGWYNGSWQFRTWRHQSWFNQRGQRFLAWQAQQQVKKYGSRDSLQSWMLPIGEVGPDPWYALNGDFSDSATRNWQKYLRDTNKLSLDTVSKMFGNTRNPFISWDQIKVPEFANFVGLPGMKKDLAGEWYVRWEDPAQLNEWWKSDVNGPGWDILKKPGSETWFNDDSKRGVKKWCIRDFELTNRQMPANTPLYLYTFLRPMDFARPHLHTPVYINNQLAGEVGVWGALEVSALLKPGTNRIAFSTDTFTGRVFISTDKPAVFPYLGEDRNRLWMLFRNWQLDGPYKMGETILAGLRQEDPNRPVKMMAPIGMGTDRWMDLASRFGAWGHFTGEGMWFFPWYKRYGYLYGIPGTSEGGGPSQNLDHQQDLFLRIFLAGLNGHDQVFLTQDITRRPELKEWYEKHIATLKQLGRYDISGPQVLIYRSTNVQQYNMNQPFPPANDKVGEVQDPWNWDIGRGTLQAIGQSYLYIDDGGVKDGKLNGYNILIDGGNETMDEKSMRGIAEWVKSGGTFITWPFTGRSTLLKPQSWPITELTGCKIKSERKPGAGTITIKKDQPYFTELAGKTFPDSGNSTDWQLNNHNQLSLELIPGPDCEVLATFDNGEPAIVVRRSGAGKVVVLGTAFFRDSKDIRGIWWPGEGELAFFRDLLTNLGQPSVNYTSDSRVWAQRYRINNGLDEVVTLVNFADGDRNISLSAITDNKPAKIYEVAGNSIKEIAFETDGKNVTVKNINIPQKEVQLYILRTNDGGQAIQYWWEYQQRMWRPLEKMPVDLSDIGKGRWGGSTIELTDDWRWSQTVGEDWVSVKLNDTAWKPSALEIMNYNGVDPDKLLYMRKHFNVPKDWTDKGGIIKLVHAAFVGQVYPGLWKAGVQIYLNGNMIKDMGNVDYYENNITRLLLPGDNVLAIAIKRGDTKFIGANGIMYLTHCETPEQKLPLIWKWSADVDGVKKDLSLPGIVPKTIYPPSRTVFIPTEWKDKYYIAYYTAGQRTSIAGVMVNGKMARRHHHWFGNNAEIDLTTFLKFGADNTLQPMRAGNDEWNLSEIELRLYPRKEKGD